MSSYGLAEVDNTMPLHYDTGKRRMKKRYIALAVVALLAVAAVVVIPTVIVLRKKDKKSAPPDTTSPSPPDGGPPKNNFVPDPSLPVDQSCKKISNTSDPSGGYGPLGKANVTFKVIADGLRVPWQMAMKTGTPTMFVTERRGNLLLLDTATGNPRVLVKVPDVAGPDFAPQGGLLGLAYDQGAEFSYLYMYVTSQDKKYGGNITYNRVERWIQADATSTKGVTVTFDKVLLDKIPAGSANNGGKLQIKDGYLYIGTGDASVPANAQDVNSMAGKILRINMDGSIPADNPFANSATWIYGMRNVGGFDWLDKDTIVLADHGVGGDQGGDRILVAKKGQNMGWGITIDCQLNKLGATAVVAPRLVYTSTNPPGDVLVYNQTSPFPQSGNVFPEWKGHVLVTSLRGQQLQDVVLDGNYNYVNNSVYFKQKEMHRIRDALMTSDYGLFFTTSNCDSLGLVLGLCNATTDSDKIYQVIRGSPPAP